MVVLIAAAPSYAALWIDLSGGELRVADVRNGASRWVVFEGTSMRVDGVGGGLLSFQAWLGQNNEDITFAYLQRPQLPPSGQLTIGAQDRTGTVGRTFFFNGGGVLPLDDLRVATDGLPVSVPEPQPTPVPEPAALTLLAGGLAFSAIGRLRKGAAK